VSVTAKPWTKDDTDNFYGGLAGRSLSKLKGGKAAGDARLVAVKERADVDELLKELSSLPTGTVNRDHIEAARAGYVARQTKLESLVEAFINIIIGYGISFMANAFILPLVGLPVTWKQNLMIGFFMTFVSVARQYAIRRWAQDKLRALNQRIVAKIKGVFYGR
jgi:hypothetical protein